MADATWFNRPTPNTQGVNVDVILIKDLIARGIIGVNESEREKPQEILLNIILFTDLHAAGQSDDIHDTVNYRTLAKQALAHAESAKRLTVEALAADIAHLCLEHPGVLKVRVRVEKPGAVRFARSVGVEIERSRDG
jgi:FolB domain-containing protein